MSPPNPSFLTVMKQPILQIGSSTYTGLTTPADISYVLPVTAFYSIPYADTPRFGHPGAYKYPDAMVPADSVGLAVRFPATGDQLVGGELVDDEGGDKEEGGAPDEEMVVHVFVPGASSSSGDNEDDGGDGIEKPKDGWPVTVYFHGGSFNFGHPLDRNLRKLATYGSVIIGVKYRLGILGFPPVNGSDAINGGLQDALAVLDWIQKYKDALGVNGEEITLMGVSAGAHLCGHVAGHPAAKQVKRVIMESGSAMARAIYSPENPQTRESFRRFREALKAPANLADRQVLNKYQETSWTNLTVPAATVWDYYAPSIRWPFQPVVDGSLIKEAPSLHWQREPPKKSILTGFCSDEGSSFVPKDVETEEAFIAFFRTLIPGLSDADAKELLKIYPSPDIPGSPYAAEPPAGFGKQWRRLQKAYGDWAYKVPVLLTAHYASAAGTHSDTTVHVYEFAAVSGPEKVAGHTSNGPTVVGDGGGTPGMTKVAQRVSRTWGEFMRGEAVDEWPGFAESGEIVVLGEGCDEWAGGTNEGVVWGRRRLSGEEEKMFEFWKERRHLSEGV